MGLSIGALSDEDVGLSPAPASALPGAPAATPSVLSDADVGLAPAPDAGPLSNSPNDGFLSGALKGAGTAIIKGAADIPGMAGNITGLSDYLYNRAKSAITGRPLDQVQAETQANEQKLRTKIGPEPLNPENAPTGADIAAPILKQTGEYKPTSEIGRMAQTGIETGIASLAGAGAARAPAATVLGAATKALPSTVAAGTIGQGVTDVTGDPLLGMAAGTAVPGVGGVAARKTDALTAPFREDIPVVGKAFTGTRDELVGNRLAETATNPERLTAPLQPSEIVPGSQPTTGQLTGDMGLLEAERTARFDKEAGIPFRERDAEQNLARLNSIQDLATGEPLKASDFFNRQLGAIDSATQATVDRLTNEAKTLAPTMPGATAEESGANLRNAIVAAQDEARALRSKLYDAVDPSGQLTVVATPVREAARQIDASVDPFATPVEGAERRVLAQAMHAPDVMTFNSLRALDSNVTAAMAAERMASGQSPAWARMAQLKDAVQGAINNALDNQHAYEQRAVAAGQIQPEDTMASHWQRLRDEWYAEQSAAGTSAQASAGNNGAARSTPVSGGNGAQVSGSGRPGNATGVEGLPGSQPLAPNFDEAAAERLGAAKAAHQVYARTYKEGPVGQALRTNGFRDNFQVPSSALPARAFVPGNRGYQTTQAFLKAAKNDPAAVTAIQNTALGTLGKSIGPDGLLSSAGLAKWKAQYAPSLRAIDEVAPGFSARFDDAAKATEVATRAGMARKAAIEAFEKGEAGKFLGKTDPVEIENTVGSLIADKKAGPTRLGKLVAEASHDAAALEGLRTAGIDWIVRQVTNAGQAGVSGERTLSAAKFDSLLKNHRAALDRLYPPETMANFSRVASDLRRAERSMSGTTVKGASNTAKDAVPFVKRAAEAAERHTNMWTAMLAGAYGAHEAGFSLPAIVSAAAGTAGLYALGSLRSAGVERMEDMFRDALLNPERAQYYAMQARPREIVAPAARVAKSLRRQLIGVPILQQARAQ